MLIYVRCRFSQFIRKQIDKVLHKITLCHEQILAYVGTVALELILGEQDVQELLVGFFVRRLYPLFKLIDIQIVLLCLERGLKGNI